MTALAVLLALAQQGGVSAWDTGKPGAPKADWTAVARDQTLDAFKGDAVVTNGRITATVRRDGTVELGDGAAARARLALVGVTRLDKISLVENARAGLALAVAGGGASVTFRLKRGEVALEAQPGPGAKKLRIEAPGRFLVLPDLFSDDMVLDARKVPVPTIDLPSENFLLHLPAGGESVVMGVFENRDQDVKVALTGSGDARTIAASEIEFGKDKRIWVAVLAAPQIWHARDLAKEDAGKTLPLEWKMPFPASWRADFTTSRDLTDTWDMLLPGEKGKGYIKPAWLGGGVNAVPPDRKRWTTVLGSFFYPCWIEPDGKGHLQPLAHRNLGLVGPVVIYPFNRVPETATDQFTVVDVARACLGVGPCEYIMDLEGQKQQNRGWATCATRDMLTAIYTKGEQKARKAEIEKRLQDVHLFVTFIRSRIERYREFVQKTRAWLAEQKKAHPELEKPIAEIDAIAGEMESKVAARADKIKTPDHVAAMNDEFRKNVMDYEGPDALEKCKAYTKALVEIGDNQDELAGEGRWVIRMLRQKSGLVMALDPRMAAIGAELRARTQDALKNPAGHEGARH
jgi:hypothetical protein